MTQAQEFFQVNWANGNTDVFLNETEALEFYAGQPELQETVQEFGFCTDAPDADAEWSDAAESAR
jgi:hypothetical protein